MCRHTVLIAIIVGLAVIQLPAAEITVHRTLDLPELTLQEGFHHFFSAPGPVYGQPGDPELPHAGHQLLLPPGEEVVSAQILNSIWQELPGEYNLWPAQTPVPYSKQPSNSFTEPDAAVYSSTAVFPASPVETFRTDFLCGHGIGAISVCAARYFPVSGQLEALTSYDLVLQTAPTARAQASLANMLKQTPRVLQRLSDRVENAGAISAYGALDDIDQVGCQYLIITGSEYEQYFQTLADDKVSRGLQTEIKLIEDISTQYTGIDLADKVRNCIIDYYQNQALEYVLMGGDTEIVPTRGLYASLGGETDYNVAADLYFSNLDGNWNDDGDNMWGEPSEADLIAEVAIGRMAVDNQSEAENMITKTLAYENNPVSADLERALMVGEDLGWLSWGWEYKEEIHLGSSSWGYTTAGFPPNFMVRTLYDVSGYSWSAMNDLVPFLNSGVNLHNHLGHADNGYVMKLTTSQVNDNNFTNNGVNHNFYILYSQGCYCASFDNRTPGGSYTSDAIAEKFTVIQHAAVAFIGNSRYGWGSYNNTNGPSQYYDRQFYDAIFGEDTFTLGWANADSKEDNIPYINNASYWCYYEINLLGDPALDAWTGTPLTFSPSYPENVILGTDEIEVNVGVEDAYVALTRQGEVLGYAQSNASGIATLSLEDPIVIPGELSLCITAHNYVPYQGIIYAVAAEGPFIIMTQVEFSDELGGDGDGNPDLGETLDFTLSFQNVGVETGYGLNATLACESYCAQINQGSADLGDLGVGATIEIADAFQVTLLPSVCDGQVLNFIVTVRDNFDSSWVSDFEITACAPGLQLVSCTLDDGNDNWLTPGETASLDVELINQGSAETTDLSVWLSTDNPLANVMVASGSLTPLLPGESGTVSGLQLALDAGMADPSALVFYIRASDTRNYEEGFLIEQPVGGVRDDMESGEGEWTHSNVQPSFGDQWNLSQYLNHTPGGSRSWYCGVNGQYAALLDAGLTSGEIPLTGHHELRFWQWIGAELSSQYPGYAYDGGIVEMSIEGGPFQQIQPRNGYPYLIRQSSNPGPFPQDTPCYSGVINWSHEIFDIEAEGMARIRFRFGSDAAINSVGWFIDDLELVKVSSPDAPANLSASAWGPEITLTWNTPGLGGLDSKSPGGDRQSQSLERYRIYRDGALIDSVEALAYVDNLTNLPYGTYYYQVSGIFSGVEGTLSEPAYVDFVGVKPEKQAVLPEVTALWPTYPNPFNPTVHVRFDLASPNHVTLIVYDLLGRTVATLADGYMNVGNHDIVWNAGDYASGLYLVQMKAGSYLGIQKMLLLK